MKNEQDSVFRPITITLETEAEAEALWAAVEAYEPTLEESKKTLDELCDFFSTRARL